LFVVEPGFPGPRRTRSVPYPYAEWSRLPTQLQVMKALQYVKRR
jgi:hypothetical protein